MGLFSNRFPDIPFFSDGKAEVADNIQKIHIPKTTVRKNAEHLQVVADNLKEQGKQEQQEHDQLVKNEKGFRRHFVIRATAITLTFLVGGRLYFSSSQKVKEVSQEQITNILSDDPVDNGNTKQKGIEIATYTLDQFTAPDVYKSSEILTAMFRDHKTIQFSYDGNNITIAYNKVAQTIEQDAGDAYVISLNGTPVFSVSLINNYLAYMWEVDEIFEVEGILFSKEFTQVLADALGISVKEEPPFTLQ